MDDYDYDDFEFDDGWLYAEDEFDLADELAENAIAEPGYPGTNFDIAMDSYEFELFAFWDDLEYADDAYWDYGLSVSPDNLTGAKRKREQATKKKAATTPDKRRRTTATKFAYDRDDDPMLFVSREERIRSFFEAAPMLEAGVGKCSFLADWRERFRGVDGVVGDGVMPGDMKRAAEAEAAGEEELGDEMDEEGAGDWEDEDEECGADVEEGEDDNEPGLDPDMLQQILKQKLGEAGLGGEDEAAFMQVIAKMMSGEGGPDDAAGELATSLLGKLSNGSGGGDSALSGWLSGQGVALEDGEDDDASSVATVELPEGLRHTNLNTRQNAAQDSPIDSVVGGEAQKRNSSTQMPLHNGSPTSSTKKKRSATTMEESEKPNKKQKKVTFDVPSSSSSGPPAQPDTSSDRAADLPTSEDPLMSESTIKKRPTRNTPRSATTTGADELKDDDEPIEDVKEVTPTKPAARSTTRKRKAADTEVAEEKSPEKKKSRKKEVDMLETAAVSSPTGPPARRTRSAKAKKGGK